MKINTLLASIILVLMSNIFPAQASENIRIAWTHYTGWELWGDIAATGLANDHIVKQCGPGSTVEIDMLNDYIGSINLYTGDEYDGVTATAMDILTIPVVGGIKTELLVLGDTSHGNDMIITNDPSVQSIKDLKGKEVFLVELSVSHYMLARALDMHGMSEADIEVINVSDADIGSMFLSTPNTTIVTWNPIAMNVLASDNNARNLFDSSQIEGEIIDALAVNSNMANCAKTALKNAWFEAVKKIEQKLPDLITALAEQSGANNNEEFLEQVKMTRFFYSPTAANDFAASPEIVKTMDYVRKFSFDHGLFNGQDVDDIGIIFPNGKTLGDQSSPGLVFK